MKPLSGILSLLIAVSGWYYMFYSRAPSDWGRLKEPRSICSASAFAA